MSNIFFIPGSYSPAMTEGYFQNSRHKLVRNVGIFVSDLAKRVLPSGQMFWDDCPDPDDWHPAADWSFYAWAWTADPQWGNPYQGKRLEKQLKKALADGLYEDADRIDRMLSGW